MKKLSLTIVLLLVLGLVGFVGIKKHSSKLTNENEALEEIATELKNDAIQNADIIFQTSLSEQSKAIQLATNSKYSHCGVIYKNDDGEYYVLEAAQVVMLTPLEAWIAKGKDNHFIVKRLKNDSEILTPEVEKKMEEISAQFLNKEYDLPFEWSDEKMYCSELVWKIYQRAAVIEVGKLDKLKDFDLTSEIVKEKLQERYGEDIPMDETVISPSAIFDSELLTTIEIN